MKKRFTSIEIEGVKVIFDPPYEGELYYEVYAEVGPKAKLKEVATLD